MTAADFLLVLIAIPACGSCLYLSILSLLSGRNAIPVSGGGGLRFDVIVPAHNEAGLIERVVSSLQALDWPANRYRIVVVADNCTDVTAPLAAAAGATVLERHDVEHRGKGYALQYAFDDSAQRRWADAVVVIDADSIASSNLLAACAARLAQGADAVQVHYGVLDPLASWRTRLMSIALGAFHGVRSRARERLGLSCGLRGNGWCVSHALLKRVPYRAFSLAEDVEYGIELGLAGYRVHYADEASVDAEMVTDRMAAESQRRRWEQGRFDLIRRQTGGLLAAAWRRRSAVCLDLALDLTVLPLSLIALNVVALLVLASALMLWAAASPAWLWIAAACGLSVAAYVLRGWQLSGMGWRGLLDLARAPGFVVWKAVLLLQPRGPLEWVRTRRRDS